MRTILLLFVYISSVQLSAQIPQEIDTAGFKTVLVKEGEQSFLLKQYFFGVYTRGDSIITDSEEKADLQAQHMAHLGKLDQDHKLCIAGPFADDGDWRGIVILSVKTEDEARKIMDSDPAVQRGTLNYILKPLWAGIGSKLY